LIIATEALGLSDNEKPFLQEQPHRLPTAQVSEPPVNCPLGASEARVRNECEFSQRMSRASMQEDQRQADPIDLKVMARAHASAALKPRQLSASGQAEYLLGGRHRHHKNCSSCVNEPADRQRR